MDNHRIKYKRFKGLEGLRALEIPWKELVLTDNSSMYLHAYEWQLSYIESLSETPDDLYYYGAYDNNQLIGIFPFAIKMQSLLGVTVNILTFPSHSHITLHDFIIKQEFKNKSNIIESLLVALRNDDQFKWDFIVFSSVIEGSNTQIHLDLESPSRLIKQIIDQSYSIDISETYEESVSHVPGNFKRNISRLERKAKKESTISFKQADISTPDTEEYLTEFIDIENDSWKGQNNSSIKSNQSFINYYQALSNNFKHPTPCVINFLKSDDTYIAGQFAILFNNRINLLKIGFRNEYSKIGPGNILLSHAINNCINDLKCHNINIITAPVWAKKCQNNSQNVYTYYVFNKSPLGLLSFAFYKALPFAKAALSKGKSYITRLKSKDHETKDH